MKITKNYLIAFVSVTVLIASSAKSNAENYYALLYVNGVASIDNMTAAQKTELVTKYAPPKEVTDSKAWTDKTAAQKWTAWKQDYMPAFIAARLAREATAPILRDESGKMEFIENYWLIGKSDDGSKYLYLLYVDYDRSFASVKKWLDTQIDLKYWYAKDLKTIGIKLLKDARDGDKVAESIAKKLIKAPMVVVDDDKELVVYRPIGDVLAAGQNVDYENLWDHGDNVVPMKIFDGSK